MERRIDDFMFGIKQRIHNRNGTKMVNILQLHEKSHRRYNDEKKEDAIKSLYRSRNLLK